MELFNLATTSSASFGRLAGTVIFTTGWSAPPLRPPASPAALPGIPPVGVSAGEEGRSGAEKLRRLCCVLSAAFFFESTLMCGSSGTYGGGHRGRGGRQCAATIVWHLAKARVLRQHRGTHTTRNVLRL